MLKFVINIENRKSNVGTREIDKMIKQKNLPKQYNYYLYLHIQG